MGRIIVQATIENGIDSTFRIQSDALVDTDAAYLALPNAWRDRLGKPTLLDTVSVETATQAVVNGDICGPVLLRMGNFCPILTGILFIEREPSDGHYEPLIGYIPLDKPKLRSIWGIASSSSAAWTSNTPSHELGRPLIKYRADTLGAGNSSLRHRGVREVRRQAGAGIALAHEARTRERTFPPSLPG